MKISTPLFWFAGNLCFGQNGQFSIMCRAMSSHAFRAWLLLLRSMFSAHRLMSIFSSSSDHLSYDLFPPLQFRRWGRGRWSACLRRLRLARRILISFWNACRRILHLAHRKRVPEEIYLKLRRVIGLWTARPQKVFIKALKGQRKVITSSVHNESSKVWKFPRLFQTDRVSDWLRFSDKHWHLPTIFKVNLAYQRNW